MLSGQYAVQHIVNVIGPSEEVEDRRTPDTFVLSQIEIITDALGDLDLTQHMTVMLVVL